MSAINQMNTFWPDWKVENIIGEGSSGKVYKVSRKIANQIHYSAIKTISVPQSQSEIDTVRSEGNDEQATRQYFQEIVDNCIHEIAVMMNLRGSSNIVVVEDYQLYEYPDRIGWDIFIRMEYLSCLKDLIINNTFTEKEVCRLGIDLCKALCCCEKHNIIHGDIKPGNIFKSIDGDYKLGDFGIARDQGMTQNIISGKGSFDYMAPEIFAHKQYDATIDIYALGLVLYKLLNNNRGPFLDAYATHISASEKEKALTARLAGHELPSPANASMDMYSVIMNACSFDPRKRYSSPAQMKAHLELILMGKPILDGPGINSMKKPVLPSPYPDTQNGLYPTEEVQHGQTPDEQIQNGPLPDGQTPDGQIQNGQTPDGQVQNGPLPDGQNNDDMSRQNIITNPGDYPDNKKKIPGLPFIIGGCFIFILIGFVTGALISGFPLSPNSKTDKLILPSSVSEETISGKNENADAHETVTEKKTLTATSSPTVTPEPTKTPTPEPTKTPAPTEAPVQEDIQVLDTAAVNTGSDDVSVDNIVYIADVYEYLTLREAPSTSAKALCLLPPYTSMYITEMTNDTMVRVITIDTKYIGYVNINYLAREGTVTTRAGKTKKQESTSDPIYYADVYDYLTLRNAASTSAGELNRLLPFTAMYVHSRTNGMAYVTVVETGETGYVNTDYITSDPNRTVRAGKSSSTMTNHGFSVGNYCYADVNEYLTLRNAPSTSAGELNRLPDDTMMVILELTNGTMMKVEVVSSGEVGYVNRDYVK